MTPKIYGADASFEKGDRVTVMDLRTGVQHPGEVVKPPAEPSDITTPYMTVRYDSGHTVRVGRGFVRKESSGDA